MSISRQIEPNAMHVSYQEYIIKREGECPTQSSIVRGTAVVRVQTRSMIFTTCGMSLWVGAQRQATPTFFNVVR